jgi:hypothetical protein
MTKPTRFISITLLAMTVAGCKSPGYGFVQQEWSNNLRQLGIVPIFPPREDIFVGDVYVYPFDPDSPETQKIFKTPWARLNSMEQAQRLQIGMSPRLGRIDFNAALDNEYARTIAIAPTSADFNGILGNPALASAHSLVAQAATELAALEKTVQDSQQALTDAERALIDAQRNKVRADAGVVEAQRLLNENKARPVDTSAEEALLAMLLQQHRDKQDQVRLSQRRLDAADPDNNTNEQAALRILQHELEDIDVRRTRTQEDLSAKRLRPADVSAEEQMLATAQESQRNAQLEIVRRTDDKDDAQAALTALQSANTPKIETAKTKLEEAKVVRDAIAEAGARLLYAQPQYDGISVFTGAAGSTDAASNSRTNRLRIVGFPEFSTTSIAQGDLSGLIPIEALTTGLNISGSNVDRVSVKIPAAESYSLSFSEVHDSIVKPDKVSVGGKEYRQFTDTFSKFVEPAIVLTGYDTSEKPNKALYFRVITEVFYARAIDVSIFSSNAFGANVNVNQSSNESGELNESTSSENQGGALNSSVPGDQSANVLLKAIQDNLDRTMALPGGSVQVVSYNDSSIGLRMVYDRPIAVGSRGISLEYNPCKERDGDGNCRGSLEGSGVMRGETPSAAPQ